MSLKALLAEIHAMCFCLLFNFCEKVHLSLSLCLFVLTAIFEVVSQYQNVSILDFIGDKDNGGGGDNWSCKMCKASVIMSPPTNQHATFFQAGCPSCCQTDHVGALKSEKKTNR